MTSFFADISIIIIVATISGYIAKLLKQPLIPAYVIAGLIIGPVLGLITNMEIITTLSEIGLAFLLFTVGLEISFTKLRDVSSVSFVGGTIQILSVFVIVFFINLILKFNTLESTYLALAIVFSSTMVVVKVLSDKRQTDTLHGRIIIGILLVQDIFAILALSVLTTLSNFTFSLLLVSLFKGIILISTSLLLIIYLMPKVFKFSARSQELLSLVSLSTCFLFALLALHIGDILTYFFSLPLFRISQSTAELLSSGFSIAVGAFIAGIGLANLPYNYEIIGKIRPIRDFFITIFFVYLGTELVLDSLNIFTLIILVLCVLIIKPVIITLITSLFGYTKRISFLTANSLAQVSEFSLIIGAQGLALGHINSEIFSMTVILAIITITLTPYLLKYEDQLYLKVTGHLKGFFDFCDGLAPTKKLEYMPNKEKVEAIICGYNRIGEIVGKTLIKMKKRILVLDFNPEVINRLVRHKVNCIYGDLGDIEIIERLPLKESKFVISTVTSTVDNIVLIRYFKSVNKNAPIIVTSLSTESALKLYDTGADYVIVPHFLGGEHVSLLLEEFTRDINKLIINKIKHIKELKKKHKLKISR